MNDPGLPFHLHQLVGKDLEGNGFTLGSKQSLIGKGGVFTNPCGPCQCGIGGKALDLRSMFLHQQDIPAVEINLYHLVLVTCRSGWETRQCKITDWKASVCGVMREDSTVGIIIQQFAYFAVSPPPLPTIPKIRISSCRA